MATSPSADIPSVPSEINQRIPCSAFTLDKRIVANEYDDGAMVETCLGMSYGPAPHEPDKFTFGMHVMGMNGDRLTIFDAWYALMPCESALGEDEALAQVQVRLSELDDAEYLYTARDDGATGAAIYRMSELTALEHFKTFVGDESEL
jgi:hypothetical protein